MARVGVAGWAIPAVLRDRFDAGESALARYASRFGAVEINSSFHRPHRRATYERWAAAVPPGFRFAVKLPKAITHERRLADCADLLARFAEESDGLGARRGPVLVQLPPSLAFDAALAESFFADAHRLLPGPIACELRHPSWFDAAADRLLADAQVARVAADPAILPAAAEPGGWPGLAYFRWHGTPQIYRSDYSEDAIARHCDIVRALSRAGREVWTIFDNTAAGHAPANALTLAAVLGQEQG